MKSFTALSVLLFAFVCSTLVCKSQNSLVKQWDYRFGGTQGELFSVLKQTFDDQYILSGYSFSDSSGNKTENSWGAVDYWIIKIDALGNKIWDTRFGGGYDDVLTSMELTNDKGFIVGGSSYSGLSGDKSEPNWDTVGFTRDYWVVKIDSNGNKQWDKRYGGMGDDVLSAIRQTSDGGYLIGGSSTSGISGDRTQSNWGIGNDYWIIKTDSLGNKIWDKRYGGFSSDEFRSLELTNDNGFLLGGYSSSDLSGDKTQPAWGGTDYWIVKIDSIGNLQWDKRFGGTNDEILGVVRKSGNGYLLAGFSVSSLGGDKSEDSWGVFDFWILQIDSLGNKIWDKDYGGNGNEELVNAEETKDKGWIVSGDSYSQTSGDKSEDNLGVEQTWIVKIDSDGNKQWDKTLLTDGHDEEGYAIQDKDGCFVIANATYADISGYKSQSPQGGADYWIIKFCESKIATSINPISFSNSDIFIFPNPFTVSTTIILSNYAALLKVQLFDELEREVALQYRITQQGSCTTFTFDRGELPSGMYFLSLASGEKREVVKVIVE